MKILPATGFLFYIHIIIMQEKDSRSSIATPIAALLRQKALLQTEYEEEKENYGRQMQATGLQRRIKRGDAWHPVRIGRCYYNSLNQFAVEVFRTADEDIEHNFEYGRPVCFFSLPADKAETADGGAKAPFNIITTGIVSYADSGRMVVTVPEKTGIAATLQNGEGIGVQMFFDETSY